MSTSTRKDEHLDLCIRKDVSSAGVAGWDQIRLPHCALPNVDFSEIDLRSEFLGQSFSAPFLISSMTGGSEKGELVNERLAIFAAEVKIPMGVGSQRVALEEKDKAFFSLRKIAPKATLYANIGAVQLNYGVSIDDCKFLIDSLEAQALILHLNPLQEAIQKEGDRNFKGLWNKISTLCKSLPVPVILKETGCGLDASTCLRAKDSGVAAVDIAGFGGTHWGYIEGLRNTEREHFGEIFRSWGIPTVEALQSARRVLGPDFPIIASGGIRNGLEAAKSLYLSANLVGMALPFLKASEQSVDSLHALYQELCESLRIALFCSDCLTPLQLKNLELLNRETHKK